MSKLPVISGKEIYKVLKNFGYFIDHPIGSHIILRNRNEPHRRLTIPNHNETAKGALRSIIRQAGLTHDEFKAYADPGHHIS